MSDTDLPMLDLDDRLQAILHETSPWGNLDAIVQHDQRTVYFYLVPRYPLPNFTTKACWVRNLAKGPLVINQDDLISGRQVMLPRNQTHIPFPTDDTTKIADLIPSSESLRVVWFEEGDGAALVQRNVRDDGGFSDQTLAVIPAWSGLKGFHGYAVDCASDSPICWPLPNNPRLQDRIDRASQFWDSFGHSFGQAPDPFLTLRDRLIQRYDQLLLANTPGQSDLQTMQSSSTSPESTSRSEIKRQYYDIGGNQFPPRGLIEYRIDKRERGERVVLLTVGMSLCCQPQVELDVENPRQYRRIELGIELNLETGDLPLAPLALANSETEGVRTINYRENANPDQRLSILNQARQELARLAAYPWRNFRWLGVGHTCQFSGVFPNSDLVRLAAQPDALNFVATTPVNLAADLSANPTTNSSASSEKIPLELISFRDDPVTLLWLTDNGQM